MPTSFTDTLLNSYDPTSNMMGAWLEQQAVDRAIARAEMEKLYQQRLAAQAAQAKSNPYIDYLRAQAAAGVTPGTGMAPVYGGTPTPAEAPGVWDQFKNRAVPQSLAGLAGGVGLLGDLIGADSVRDWGLETSKYLNDIAAQTPRTVASLEDVLSGKGDFSTWLQESAIDLAPDLIGTIATGGAGGLAARSGATLAAKVAGKKLAEETAKKALQRGALAGAYGYGVGAEGGQAYLTDAERHGVEGTSPWMDLTTGAVASAFDLAGPAGGLVLKALGRPVSKAASEKLLRTLASEKTRTAFRKGLGKGALAEGGTEFLQELTQIINEQLQSPELEWTPRDTMRLIESGVLGGIFGAPIGAVSRVRAKQQAPAQLEALLREQDAERWKPTQVHASPNWTPFESVDTFFNQDPFVSATSTETTANNIEQSTQLDIPTEKEAEAATQRLRRVLGGSAELARQQYNAEVAALDSEIQTDMNTLATLTSNPPQGMPAENVKALIAQTEKSLANRQARKVKLQQNTDEKIKAIQKTLEKEEQKLAHRYLDEEIIDDQFGLVRNPFDATELIHMRAVASAYYRDGVNKVKERLRLVSQQLETIRKSIAENKAAGTYDKNSVFQNMLDAAINERNALMRKMTSLHGAYQRLRAGTKNLRTSQYDAKTAYEDYMTLRTVPEITDISAADKVANKYMDKARKEQERALRKQRRQFEKPRSPYEDMSLTDIEIPDEVARRMAPTTNILPEGQSNLPAVSQAIPMGTTRTGRGPIATPFTRDTRPIPMGTRGEDLAIETQATQEERLLNQWDKDYREQAIAEAFNSRMPRNASIRALPQGEGPYGRTATVTPPSDAARGEMAWRSASEAQRRRSSPYPDTRPDWTYDVDERTTYMGEGPIELPAGVEQQALPEGTSTAFDHTPDNFYGTTPEVKGFVESNPDIKSPMISRFPEAVDAFYNYTPDIVEGTWLMMDPVTKPIKTSRVPADPKRKNSPDNVDEKYFEDVAKYRTKKAPLYENFQRSAEKKYDSETRALRKLLREAAIETDKTKKKSLAKRIDDAMVQVKEALHKLAIAAEARIFNLASGDYGDTRIYHGIKPTLRMLPHLARQVYIVNSTEVPRDHKSSTGFLSQDGKIYLVSDNIFREAELRKKPYKEIAVKTLMHEGIAHYGLRAIMSPSELKDFLRQFRKHMEGTATWKNIGDRIALFEGMSPARQAEEVFAKLSERYKVADLLSVDRNEASVWMTQFFSKLSTRAGIPKLTRNEMRMMLANLAWQFSPENYQGNFQRISDHAQSITSLGLARSLDPNLESMTRVERAEAEAAQRFPFSNRVQEAVANRENTIEYLREGLIDSFRPVERMIQAVKDLGKKAGDKARVTWDTNVYKLSQHLSSQQALALQQYKTNFVDPLVDLISDTALPGEDYRVTFARVSDYVEAVAAYERNDFGAKKGLDFPLVPGKKGTSLQESQDYFRSIINKYSSESMNKVMDQLQKINNERLRLLEEKKIIPKEVIDNWRAAYKYYMPFKSWENVVQELDPAWYNSNTRRSLSTPNVQKKIMKRATGREGEAQNPILHSILQLYDVSNLSRTVDIGRSLLRLVRNNPDATNIFEMVEYRDKNDKDWGKPRLTTDPETGEQVYVIDHGAMKRVVNKQTGDISLVPTKHTAEGEIKNTVAVIDEDGTVQRVLLHDSGVARALRAENLPRASGVIRTIGAIQHELGKYMTSRNPLFWIRNPMRDAVSAAINISALSQELEALGIPNSKEISQSILVNGLGKALSKNSVRNALMYFRKYGTFDDVTIKNKDGSTKTIKSGLSDEMKMFMSDYEQYLNYGGQTEYFGTNTYETLRKDILSALKDKNPKTFLEKQRSNVNKMMEYMDEVSNSLENMTRYIAFKEIVDRLKPYAEAGRTADNRPFSYEEMYSRAANIALNLTVNFSRKGSWAPIFNSLYMFASASIGGNVRMLETIFRKDRKTGKTDWNHVARFAMYPLLGYTLQAIIARALMGDDDDGVSFYDKLPEYIKASNIIIPSPISKGDYIALPIAYGPDMFWNLGMNIYEALHSAAYGNPGPNATEAASSIIGKMFNNFATIGGTDEGWTSFIPSIVRPLWQLSQNKNFAGNPIMPTGNENLRGEIPDHEKYWSTANPSLVAFTKMLSPVIDVSPESVEHIANAYLGGLGRITFGLLGRVDEIVRYGFDRVDMGKVPGLNVLYKTTQDSDTSALFSKMRTNVLTQINAVDTARTDMRLTPEEKREVLMDNLQGYRLKPTLNKLQQQLNLLREQERRLMNNPSISSEAKATRLDQINQLKQRAMKQFIKTANQAGVIG